MHVYPLNTWLHHLHNFTISFKDYLINVLLLLRELTIDREGGSYIGGVVMHAMTLINEHGLPILEILIIIHVVKSSCPISAATNWVVGRNLATSILLLAVSLEYGDELGLSHAWFAVSHVFYMSFASNSGGPSHDIDLLLGLSCSAI